MTDTVNSSVSYSEQLRDELKQRDSDREKAARRVTSNPPFIAEDDQFGVGHPRSTREAARFQTAAQALRDLAEPVEPEQATVKTPRLRAVSPQEWQIEELEVSGAVTFKKTRPGKFAKHPDINSPSKQLAEFLAGRGEVWESGRDSDLAALLKAWAESVQPTAADARHASAAVAMAMGLRAGIDVTRLSDVTS